MLSRLLTSSRESRCRLPGCDASNLARPAASRSPLLPSPLPSILHQPKVCVWDLRVLLQMNSSP
jgi:hypothetical protein